jgi:predicted ATPase
LAYTSAVIHTRPVTIRCPLLIGRDDLLDLVDRRIDEVVAGRGQFLLIAGEAGIGKTRFLGAIVQKAAALGIPTISGAVSPQDRDVPAASILDLARTMTWMGPYAAAGQALLRLADSTRATEHVRRRHLVMEAVDVILDAFRRPSMLSFEDLQWADDVSLEIIGELARRSRDRDRKSVV